MIFNSKDAHHRPICLKFKIAVWLPSRERIVLQEEVSIIRNPKFSFFGRYIMVDSTCQSKNKCWKLTQNLDVEVLEKSWHVCKATWHDWMVQVWVVTGKIVARSRRNVARFERIRYNTVLLPAPTWHDGLETWHDAAYFWTLFKASFFIFLVEFQERETWEIKGGNFRVKGLWLGFSWDGKHMLEIQLWATWVSLVKPK